MKTNFGSKAFIVIDGEGMNYLNQFQILSSAHTAQTIHIRRYAVRFAPFTRGTVNQQFPMFIPIEGLQPGRYSILIHAKGGIEETTLAIP